MAPPAYLEITAVLSPESESLLRTERHRAGGQKSKLQQDLRFWVRGGGLIVERHLEALFALPAIPQLPEDPEP